MKTNLLKSIIVVALIVLSNNLKAFTAVVSGAWSSATTWGGVAPGATVSNQDIIIPNGITVDLDMDVTFSGLVNSFTLDGIMNSAADHNLTISSGSFTGAGSLHIWRLSFSGLLSTCSHSGSLFPHVFRNQGSNLTLAGVVNISDTLDLDGGTIVLTSGSNMTLQSNSNVRINNGSITTSGGVFNTNSYDAWYVGTSKTTGLELNTTTLNNLHINLNDNTQAITQGVSVVHVGGSMDMQTGEYSLGSNQLIIQSDLSLGSGAVFVSGASSDLTLGGAGPVADNLSFSAGSSIHNLVINRYTGGSVGLSTPINIVGNLDLTNGDLVVNSGGMITMNSGSGILVGDGQLVMSGGTFVGTASYNVGYTNHSHTTGIEVTGSGLNNLTVGMIATTETLTMDTNIIVNGNLNMLVGNCALSGYDLTLNGTFSQDQSTTIIGDTISSLTLNMTSTATDTIYFGGNLLQCLKNLTLNIPAGSMILVATDLTILNQLNLMSGKLEITNANFHLAPAATFIGYNDTKYIVTAGTGQLEMWVNSNSTYVVFPVGTSTYAPAQLQQTSSGTSGMFHVRAMDGVFTQGLTGFNSATTESVVNKTWEIDAAVGVTVDLNLKLGWVVGDEVNGFDRTSSYAAHYTNSAWDMFLPSAAVAGANNTYETTRTGITSLSPFAVVDATAFLSVEPIVRNGINIYPNPTIDNLTIETGDVHGNYLYEIYDATGKIVYTDENTNSVNRINVKDFVNGFYFIRITDTTTKVAITKRIIKD